MAHKVRGIAQKLDEMAHSTVKMAHSSSLEPKANYQSQSTDDSLFWQKKVKGT
jgi:hypothetical protein